MPRTHVGTRLLPLLAGLTLLAWAAPTGAAAAAGDPFKSFSVPTDAGFPRHITVGPDRALWFIQGRPFRPMNIVRLSRSGKHRTFPLPRGTSRPLHALVTGPDGALWYPDGQFIGRMTVDGSVTRYPLPADLFTQAITPGPDGALWFVATIWRPNDPDDRLTDRTVIGRITVDGQITQYPLTPRQRIGDFGPMSITPGPDGGLWFTREDVGLIGRISTAGDIREFQLPGFWSPTCARSGTCLPSSITSGADGRVWFVASTGDKIGRMSVDGRLQVFRDRCANLTDIVAGPDGAMWFTAPGDTGGGYVGRITRRGTVKRWALPISAKGRDTRSGFPRSSFALEIVGGPDNALWFTTGLTGPGIRSTPVIGVGRVAARIARIRSTVSPPGGPRGCKRRSSRG